MCAEIASSLHYTQLASNMAHTILVVALAVIASPAWPHMQTLPKFFWYGFMTQYYAQ